MARDSNGRFKKETGRELDIPPRDRFVYNESNLSDAKKAEVHDFICEVMRYSKQSDLERKRLKGRRDPNAGSQEMMAAGKIMACQDILDWLCARYGSGPIVRADDDAG